MIMHKVEIISDDEISDIYKEFGYNFIYIPAGKIKTRTKFFTTIAEEFKITEFKGFGWDTFMEWLIKEPTRKDPIAILFKDFVSLLDGDEDFRDEVIRMFNLVIIPYYESRPEIEIDGVNIKPQFRVFVGTKS